MPAAKKPRAKKPAPTAPPPAPPVVAPPPVTLPPVAPTAFPPMTPEGVTISLAERDAMVTKLDEAERQFLGGWPIGAKPMIAEVAAKLKSL